MKSSECMDDRQKLKVEIVFNVKHSPGNEAHLREIVRSYFKGKGVPTEDGPLLFVNLDNNDTKQ